MSNLFWSIYFRILFLLKKKIFFKRIIEPKILPVHFTCWKVPGRSRESYVHECSMKIRWCASELWLHKYFGTWSWSGASCIISLSIYIHNIISIEFIKRFVHYLPRIEAQNFWFNEGLRWSFSENNVAIGLFGELQILQNLQNL